MTPPAEGVRLRPCAGTAFGARVAFGAGAPLGAGTAFGARAAFGAGGAKPS